MIKKSYVTLNDIAKRLEVSKVTVSKALRGHPDIPPVTVDKVKAMAKELGYTPNYIARNLSAKKTQMIGLVVPKIAHSFFSNVIETIYKKAFKQNYEIILMVSQENADMERSQLKTLLSMRVDGILISISQETTDKEPFEEVRSMGTPLVFFDRVLENAGFSTVTVDDKKGAYLAVEHAIKTGYSKIAHIGGRADISIGSQRLAGYLDALIHNDIPIRKDWIIESGFGVEDGYKAFQLLRMNEEMPEIIFTVGFSVSLGVFNAIQDAGLRIPEDIDIISFGNSHVNNFIRPAITYIDQPAEELGERALDVLLEEINKPELRATHNCVINTSLVEKDTCRLVEHTVR